MDWAGWNVGTAERMMRSFTWGSINGQANTIYGPPWGCTQGVFFSVRIQVLLHVCVLHACNNMYVKLGCVIHRSSVSLIHMANCMTLQKSCNKSLIIPIPGAQLSDPAAWHLPHVCWRALWLRGPCRPLLLAAPQICCFHLKNGCKDN